MNNNDGKIWYGLGIDNRGLEADANKSKEIFRGIGTQATSDCAKMERGFNALGKTIASLGVAVTIEEMARALYNFSANFNKAMLEVSTISDYVSNDMEGAKQKTLELTTEIPIAADEATKALYQIVSAGYDGAKGMNVLEVSAKTAIGGVTDTATAADAITTLLNAYKLSASEAESISDKLFTTVKLGKTTMGELGQNVAQVAPLAAAYGVEMDQVLAGVATLTKSGTPTAQAMTQIRGALIASTKVLGDGYYATHTFQEGLSAIAEMAGGSESKLRELVPEVEGMNAVLGLTGINAKTAAGDLFQLNEAFGATDEACSKMLADSDVQLQLLRNNALQYFSDLGNGIMNSVGSIAEFLNEAFASGAIERFSDAIIVLVSAFGIYKGAVIATTIVQKLQNAVITEAILQKRLAAASGIMLSNAEAMAAARTTLLSAAQFKLVTALKAVKVAMLSNPWTAAFVAITAVITAVALFRDKTDEATESQDNFNDSVKDAMTIVSKEKVEIDRLFNTLRNAKKGTDEYNEAKRTIQNNYKQYLSGLSDEISSLNDIEAAYKAVSEAALQSARDKAKTSITGTLVEEQAKKETDFIQRLEMLSSDQKKILGEYFKTGVTPDFGNFGGKRAPGGGTMGFAFHEEIKDSKLATSEILSEGQIFDVVIKPIIDDLRSGRESVDREIQALDETIVSFWGISETPKPKPKPTKPNVLNPITEEDKILIEGSIAWYEEQIKLLQEKRKTLTDAGEIAKVDVQIKGYQDGIDGLNGVDAEAERNKEILDQYRTFTEKYTKLQEDFEADKIAIKKAGGTDENISVREEQYNQDLESLNNEVINSIDGFEELAQSVTDANVAQIINLLKQAKEAMIKDGKSIDSNEVKAVDAQIKKMESRKPDVSPSERSLKEWQDMEEQLNDCITSFEDMGDAIGGVAGEVISTAGSIATSTLSVISGITQLVQGATAGMSTAASTAAASVRAVETASVILAVISAAIQVAMQIAQLFNKDDDYQEEIERLQGEIDSLEWQLQNRDIVHMKENNINLLQNFRDTLKETTNEVCNQYIEAGKLKTVWDFIANSAQIAADIQSETAKKLAASYANISYSDSTIGGMEQFDDATKKVEALAEQQVLLQKQINNENAKKKTDHGQIAEWEQQIQELGAEAVTIINEAFEAIMGGSALDWANDLGDALFDAAKKGEDGMIAWGDKTKSIVGDIMQQLLIQQLLMPEIEKIFDKYKKSWFKDNKFVGFDAVMDDMPDIYNDLLGLYSPMADAMDGLPEELKEILGFSDADSSEREGSTASGITASQDSVNESNGRLTVIQGHTYGLFESVKVTQVDVTAIRSSVDLIYTCMSAILNVLIGIEKNTSNLEDMKKDMHDMKNGIDSLNDGVVLKKR